MRITIGNWLYNAGIVGFLRILDENGIPYSEVIRDGAVFITPELLKGFEDAYFKRALKNQYETLLIIKEQNKIKEVFNNEFNTNFDDIKGRYLSQLKLIKCDGGFKEYSSEVVNVIDSYFNGLLNIIENSSLKGKKIDSLKKKISDAKENKFESIKNHNVFSNYFGNFYFNKQVLCNPKGAIDRLKRFKDKYVVDALKALKETNKGGIVCRFCNQNKVNSSDISLTEDVFNEGLFSISGVSVEKFKNFFYNTLPDLFLCNLCELILLCSFAGLNKKPYRLVTSDGTDYIFVNMPSLELLIEENDALKSFYDNFSEKVEDSIYESVLQDILLKYKRKQSKWVLQNIFFVELKTSARKDTGKPVFKYFHVGKDIAELFSNQKVVDTLRNVKGALNLQKDIWVNIKSETVKRLLESDSLYPLVYKNLRGFLDNGKGYSYNSFALAFVLAAKRQINIHYSKGGDLMEPKQVYGILRHQFFARGEEDFTDTPFEKKERLSYRLLSLIRMGKYAEFYEAIMKLYINSGKSIPEELLSLLNTKDTIDFEAKAYAFMTGFLQNTKRSENIPITALKEETKDE
jgi:CRISPR-associated protein Cst1